MFPAVRARGLSWARNLTVAASTLVACAPPPAAPAGAGSTSAAGRALPAGCVLTLNGTPIQADEVDAIGSIVARIEVSHTLPDLRRIALTNVVLPRVAARQVAGEARHAASRALTEAWRAVLVRGEAPPAGEEPQAETLRGGLLEVGLEVWNWSIDAPLDTWSEPIETAGAWRLARVVERSAGLRPADVVLAVDVRTIVWDPSPTFRQDVEAHLDRSKLEYVDAAWRDVVPTLWQRRLRGT